MLSKFVSFKMMLTSKRSNSLYKSCVGPKNSVVVFSLDTVRHLFGHIFGQVKKKSKVAKHS